MKYLLKRTKFLATGGIKTLDTSMHDDLKSAEAKFYRNVGTDLDDNTLSGSSSIITDVKGNIHNVYVWGDIIDNKE